MNGEHAPAPLPIEAMIDDLPEASRRWLAEQNRTRSADQLRDRPAQRPILAAIGALAAAALALAFIFSPPRSREDAWNGIENIRFADGRYAADVLDLRPTTTPMTAGQIVGIAVVGLAAALVAACAFRLGKVLSSPYGAFVTLHPAYLLEVAVDRVRAWPLAQLREVRVSHREFSSDLLRWVWDLVVALVAAAAMWLDRGSTLVLVFGERDLALELGNRPQAERWAARALAYRDQPEAPTLALAKEPAGVGAPRRSWRLVMLAVCGAVGVTAAAITAMVLSRASITWR